MTIRLDDSLVEYRRYPRITDLVTHGGQRYVCINGCAPYMHIGSESDVRRRYSLVK